MGAFITAQAYSIQGVAEDDTLNVRTQPDTSAAVIATLDPKHAAVLWTGMSSSSEKSSWWRIATPEFEGWVNARFLARAAAIVPETPTLLCAGNEPFWALHVRPDGSAKCEESCAGPDGLRAAVDREAPGQWAIRVTNADATPFLAALVTQQTCSDGMSDFSYALSVRMQGPRDAAYAGCCRLTFGPQPPR